MIFALESRKYQINIEIFGKGCTIKLDTAYMNKQIIKTIQ